MLSHLSEARVRLIPVDTNCKNPSWMSGTPNRFKNLTVWDELCVYGMCVFERMDMDVPVPQHAGGRPKSILRCPCLPYTLFETLLFWCYVQQAIWKPLDNFLTSVYRTTSRVLELQTHRFSSCAASTVLLEPSPFNDVQASPIHKTPAAATWSCSFGDKVVEGVARARRWSWGEDHSRAAEAASLHSSLLLYLVTLWNLPGVYLWSLPIAGAEAWEIRTHPAPITFFPFLPNAPN